MRVSPKAPLSWCAARFSSVRPDQVGSTTLSSRAELGRASLLAIAALLPFGVLLSVIALASPAVLEHGQAAGAYAGRLMAAADMSDPKAGEGVPSLRAEFPLGDVRLSEAELSELARLPGDSERSVAGEAGGAGKAPQGKAKPRSSKQAPSSQASSLGYRVSAATVLRLANSGYVPSGAPVPAVAGAPAGVRISGVSGLGLGPRDGDILFRVAGAPVRDVGDVVAMVLAARGRRASTIGAQLWRPAAKASANAATRGQIVQLLVELPYVTASAPNGSSAKTGKSAKANQSGAKRGLAPAGAPKAARAGGAAAAGAGRTLPHAGSERAVGRSSRADGLPARRHVSY